MTALPATRHLLAAILLVLAAAGAAGAAKKDRALIEGVVMDSAGEAVEGVRVRAQGEAASGSATTDRRGRFSIELVAGEFVVEMEREGYAPFAAKLVLEAGQRQSIEVNLLDAAAGRRNEAITAYNEAATALRAGDKATARARLPAAIEADPTLPEPYRLLADLLLEAGEHTEAAAAAEAYLELRPGDRDMQVIAYEAYRGLGDEDRAAALRRELAAAPKLAAKLAVQAYNDGAVALQQGDEAAAVARFEEALALDETLGAAHAALASLFYNRESYAEARAANERLLALEPGNAQGRRMAFLIADAGGDREAGAAAMEALIEVDAGGAAELLYKRADLDFKAGELEPARAGLERLLALEPDEPRGHHLLGLVLLSTDTGRAQQHLKRFLELAPDDPEAATVREILAGL